MPFSIVRNDITRMAVDAIVNSASPHLLGGAGADAAIHRAAGPELRQACRALGGCKPGQVKATPGFRLPCRYVLHTVAPIWLGGKRGEEDRLRTCYRNALQLARQMELKSLAFPLMSAGAFGVPRAIALRVATDEIRDFVLQQDMQVYLVVYDRDSYQISARLQQDIRQYIDDHYVEQQTCQPLWNDLPELGPCPEETAREAPPVCMQAPMPSAVGSVGEASTEAQLMELLDQRDESFTEMLLRKIDESGMTDPECYRLANIDRRLFSKIRNNPHYQPTKPTALAFALALRLSREETDQLLRTAGLALSRSSHFDLIVQYFMEQGVYDVIKINQALYDFDQPLLGNR